MCIRDRYYTVRQVINYQSQYFKRFQAIQLKYFIVKAQYFNASEVFFYFRMSFRPQLFSMIGLPIITKNWSGGIYQIIRRYNFFLSYEICIQTQKTKFIKFRLEFCPSFYLVDSSTPSLINTDKSVFYQ
eukprot:TRINITY_DN6034_c0_g1_i1.p1 TRINITY_DN6034_c0_g1~~TRINITY_DN6034_c0_g1_i1.p1  ORF type:complete len:129 (-),score=5.27 TRINITY_DN6034_c0_g1_i1:246-632(-)